MTNINVSFQELHGIAERLSASREEIGATLARLQAQIDGLVSAGFTTDRSSSAFADAYTRFTNGAQNAVAGLDDLARFLRSTAQTLGDVDAQLAARPSR